MKIDQRKFSHRHSFEFEDDRLSVTYQDRSGTQEVEVAYADLPLKTAVRIIENVWLRNVGYLWCALGAVMVVLAFINNRPLSGAGSPWIPLGVGCLLWAYYTKVHFTLFETRSGTVWVIQNGEQHDKIVAEMRDRRKQQLLNWYGAIDLDNDPDKEIAKFRWLVDQKALTAEEAQRNIAHVMAAHQSAETAQTHLLN